MDHCTTCKDGYFLLLNECIKCDENLNCKTCEYNNAQYCTSCKEGYFLFEGLTPEGNRCEVCNVDSCFYCDDNEDRSAKCYEGFYLDNSVCAVCDTSCRTCEDLPNFCTSCFSNYYLNETTKTCHKCASICNECMGPAENNCLGYFDGYYLSSNRRCFK